MRFVPSFPSDDREYRLIGNNMNIPPVGDFEPGPDATIDTPNTVPPAAKEVVRGSALNLINDVSKQTANIAKTMNDQMTSFGKSVLNNGLDSVKQTGERVGIAFGNTWNAAVDAFTPGSKPGSKMNAGPHLGVPDAPNQQPQGPAETKEVPKPSYDAEKLNQQQLRERAKVDAAGPNWSTLDVGVADGGNNAYVYKKIEVNGKQVLVANSPIEGTQYLDENNQWHSVDPKSELASKIGVVNHADVIKKERDYVNSLPTGHLRAAYEGRMLQNGRNRDMERTCLMDPTADEAWFKQHEKDEMWGYKNEPIRDALKARLSKGDEKKPEVEEKKPEDEKKKPEEDERKPDVKPDEKEKPKDDKKKPDESKEKEEESPDARAKRILEELQKQLTDLEAKDKPEEKKKEEPKTSTEEESKVKETEESKESDKDRRNKLWAEVRGAKPMKTVVDVKKEKTDAIGKIDSSTGTQLDELRQDVSNQNDKVSAIQMQLNTVAEDGAGQDVTDKLQSELATEKAKLDTMEDNLQTAKDKVDVRKKELEKDIEELDKMEAETKKTAERADKRLDAIGTQLISSGEPEIGKGAQNVTVKHDGSLGFKVDAPADLVTRLDAWVGEEPEKELNGDNPAVILIILDSVLTGAKERKK